MSGSDYSPKEDSTDPHRQAAPTLQSYIHTATRSLHAQLNKTITARLPLCLPPYSIDPAAYYLGIIAFGQIFRQFESAIESILRNQDHHPTTTQQDQTSARHLQILTTLHTPDLRRTDSINHDLETLQTRLQHSTQSTSLLNNLEQQVQTSSSQQTSHIAPSISNKPYLALAYTWTMYLALFNGGRYLHRQLASAGPAFWLEDPIDEEDTNTNTAIKALSFWHFSAATPSDPTAEQLKLTFKSSFDQASQLLTPEEVADVVAEAKSIFELCGELVDTLDCHLATAPTAMVSIEKVDQGLLPQTDPGFRESGITAKIWSSLGALSLGPTVLNTLRLKWARPLKPEGEEVG